MDRKKTVTTLIVIFGFIILVLTVFEYLLQTLSIVPDPVIMYWIEIFYLICIMIFLLLLVIYLEVRSS